MGMRRFHLNPNGFPLVILKYIGYEEETGHIFVTGKCWPKIYEIELVSPE
jgi:glutamine cyclotransferase